VIKIGFGTGKYDVEDTAMFVCFDHLHNILMLKTANSLKVCFLKVE